MINSPWTADKIAYVRRHWKKGKSASEIGREIGVSRSAVIGKADRLGLNGRPAPTRRADRLKARKAKRADVDTARVRLLNQAAATVTAANGNAAPELEPRGARCEPFTVTLADLGHDDCRYPEGDRVADMRFCGAPCRPDSSYCEHHHARCWDTPAERTIAAARRRAKPGRLTHMMQTLRR